MNCGIKDGRSLYYLKGACSGCGVCVNVCPEGAIVLKEDDLGFYYPHIDKNLCICCGKCIQFCAFGKEKNDVPIRCYAGMNLNAEQRMLSASAGIFSAVATAFLKNDGVVCGAAMNFCSGKARIQHILIDTIDDLPQLQGSKYVQSDVLNCYYDMQAALKSGKKVLFSGTPCQIAGVKSLFKKYENQLYTMDIICHGVPSQRFFNDYLVETA